MQQNSTASLPTHGLRWGAILGVITIALTTVMYAVDYTLMINWKVSLLLTAIFIGFVIFAGFDFRKSAGGFLAYSKAFQHGIIVFAVSGLISTLFSLVLYTIVDPELPAKLTESAIETTTAMLEGMGVSEDAIDEAIEKSREETAKRFTLTGTLTSYAVALIVYAVLALITAIFVKKNEPMEM